MAHTYILGQSQSGKTTVLYDRFLSTVQQPCLFFGETDFLLDYIPKKRRQDVLIMDRVQWNPLTGPDTATIIAEAIKDAWGYSGLTTPDMDLYLTFTFLALSYANKPFSDFTRFYTDNAFRQNVLKHCQNDIVQGHWEWYDKATERDRRAEAKSSLNKLLVLFSDPATRRLFSHSRLSLRDSLKDKILLVPMSDRHRSPLIASILLSILESMLDGPFHFYLDDVQYLAPSVVIDLLATTGKHGGSVSVAHQYIDQVKPELYHALMGNCREKLIFATSEDDARTLDRHVEHDLNRIAFDNLEPHAAIRFPYNKKEKYFKLDWKHEPMTRSRADIMANHELNLC